MKRRVLHKPFVAVLPLTVFSFVPLLLPIPLIGAVPALAVTMALKKVPAAVGPGAMHTTTGICVDADDDATVAGRAATGTAFGFCIFASAMLSECGHNGVDARA